MIYKIVKINMTNAGKKLCGTLTPEQKEVILTRLAEASLKVKSDIQSERAEGKSICKNVDGILRGAGALLRVSTKDNSDYTKNRIQARVSLDLRGLEEFCEVDNKPAMSPVISVTTTPTLKKTEKGKKASFADIDIVLQGNRRSNQPTPFSQHFTPEEFAGKNEQIGKIVMEAMRKDPSYTQHLQRIYSTSPGSKKSRPRASRSTTPASASRKPRISAPGSTPSASAGRTPSQDATSARGASASASASARSASTSSGQMSKKRRTS